MEGEGRRVLTAMVVAMMVLIGYQLVVQRIFPTPPPPETQPASTQPQAQPAIPPAGEGTPPRPSTTGPGATAPAISPGTQPRRQFSMTTGEDLESIELGGGPEDKLRLRLSPIGATLESIDLCAREKDGKYEFREAPDVEAPYTLITPVVESDATHRSYATYGVWIKEFGDELQRLDGFTWNVVARDAERVVFATELLGADGDALLRFTKTYALKAGQPLCDLTLEVENLTGMPLDVRLKQDGPVGVGRENDRTDMRRLLATQRIEGAVHLNKSFQHNQLQEATQQGEPIALLVPEKGPFVWTALANKYFGVYTRAVPKGDGPQDFVIAAHGLVDAPYAVDNRGDLLARLTLKPTVIAPGAKRTYPLEIYAGPKDIEHLKPLGAAYVDQQGLYYQVAQSADRYCFCTFGWLQDLMVWLLESIYWVFGNYGIAIIILVIIIRGLLHKLTVFQQTSMFKMQENMARIQPKMQAIKEKYANDKVKQNQETMKLFSEEGVNPASNFVAFLPLFLQMPILVALWQALNTDVNLRHAPFDGWWIEDLSAPDAFYTFAEPVSIPILSAIPWIGDIFTGIESINLLPILMGVSMYLQQKYMPKPHVQAKQERAVQKAQQAKSAGGLTPEDQIRQQRMVANMMSVLFPVMFYVMPAGLNLYWLSTNVFGVFESLLIRKQIAKEKERREREGPPVKKSGRGPVGRFMDHLAKKAEELQKQADEVSKKQPGTRDREQRDSRRKGRK